MTSLATRALNKAKRIALENTDSIRGAAPAVIIGAGGISPAHIAGYRASVLAYPAAVCDISPQSIGAQLNSFNKLKGFLSLEEMLAKTQPVIASVCTWNSS